LPLSQGFEAPDRLLQWPQGHVRAAGMVIDPPEGLPGHGQLKPLLAFR
jgi:hypothetical protein